MNSLFNKNFKKKMGSEFDAMNILVGSRLRIETWMLTELGREHDELVVAG